MAIRADHLVDFILSKEGGKTWCKVVWTFFLNFHTFEDNFSSTVKTLALFCLHLESKVNRDIISRSKTLLNHLSNFSFIVTLIDSIKIFDFIHYVTELLQVKLYNNVLGFDLIVSLVNILQEPILIF